MMTFLNRFTSLFRSGAASGRARLKNSGTVSFEPCDETRSGARHSRAAISSPQASAAIMVDQLESRILLSVPNGPFGLTATATSSSAIQVAWYSNSTNESGFRIERSIGGVIVGSGTVGAG